MLWLVGVFDHVAVVVSVLSWNEHLTGITASAAVIFLCEMKLLLEQFHLLHHDSFLSQVSSSVNLRLWHQCFTMRNCHKRIPALIKKKTMLTFRDTWSKRFRQFGTGSQFLSLRMTRRRPPISVGMQWWAAAVDNKRMWHKWKFKAPLIGHRQQGGGRRKVRKERGGADGRITKYLLQTHELPRVSEHGPVWDSFFIT